MNRYEKESHLQIDKETHQKLKILSSVEGKSMKQLIMEMVDQKIKKYPSSSNRWFYTNCEEINREKELEQYNKEFINEFKPGATMKIRIGSIEPEKFKGRKVVRF